MNENKLDPPNLSPVQIAFVGMRRTHPAAYANGFRDQWLLLSGETKNISNRYGRDKPIAQMLWCDGARKAAEIWPSGDFSQIPPPESLLVENQAKNSESRRILATGRVESDGTVRIMRMNNGTMQVSQGVQ